MEDRTSLNSPIKELGPYGPEDHGHFLFRCWAGDTKILNFDPWAYIGPVYLPSIFKSIILTFSRVKIENFGIGEERRLGTFI